MPREETISRAYCRDRWHAFSYELSAADLGIEGPLSVAGEGLEGKIGVRRSSVEQEHGEDPYLRGFPTCSI